MIDAWNKSMSKNFLPSWINTIDKSISKWINEFTCPGFMYVPCKPWPFSNEYHDAGCADSDIIWQVDLREGKDHPVQLGGGGGGGGEHDDKGKTTGTLFVVTHKTCSWNRKSVCSRQWLLCFAGACGIKEVWSLPTCSDQETMILAEVCPWGSYQGAL